MNKKKNLIIGVILVIVACMVCATWYSYTNVGSASFDSTNGHSKIIVNKSKKKTGGSVGVNVKKGEKIVIRSYLEKGSIEINLGKTKTPQTKEQTLEELSNLINGKDITQIVKGHNTYEIEVPEGNYYGVAVVLEQATGEVTITSEGKEQLKQ